MALPKLRLLFALLLFCTKLFAQQTAPFSLQIPQITLPALPALPIAAVYKVQMAQSQTVLSPKTTPLQFNAGQPIISPNWYAQTHNAFFCRMERKLARRFLVPIDFGTD